MNQTRICSYCKKPGHRPRNCKGYLDRKARKKAEKNAKGGGSPTGLSREDVGRMDGHITAQARALACERAQEELEESRTRLREAEAEVKVLERLVGRLTG